MSFGKNDKLEGTTVGWGLRMEQRCTGRMVDKFRIIHITLSYNTVKSNEVIAVILNGFTVCVSLLLIS